MQTPVMLQLKLFQLSGCVTWEAVSLEPRSARRYPDLFQDFDLTLAAENAFEAPRLT